MSARWDMESGVWRDLDAPSLVTETEPGLFRPYGEAKAPEAPKLVHETQPGRFDPHAEAPRSTPSRTTGGTFAPYSDVPKVQDAEVIETSPGQYDPYDGRHHGPQPLVRP